MILCGLVDDDTDVSTSPCQASCPAVAESICRIFRNRRPARQQSRRCFFCDEDRLNYLDLLSRYARRLGVELHAFVLMSNHLHLLATPQDHGAISTLPVNGI